VGGGIYREEGKDECGPGCSLRGGVLGLYERALLFHHSSVVGNSGGSLEIPLSPDALDEVVKDCLADQDEVIFRDGVEQLEHFEDFTIVRGLVTAFALHKERLEVHRPLVIYWLGLLSKTFKENGWTFLQVPFLADGTQWGEQKDADILMVLGMGLDLVHPLLPRALDSSLVGGVPYFKFAIP